MSRLDPAAAAAELYTPDQLEAHAAKIAGTHRLASNPRRGRPLLPRLVESAHRLEETYQFLSRAARRDPQPVGAEDWLRDNHHVVQDQVRDIRQHLPRRYYLELPKLADGPQRGYPRIYLLACELISHTAGRIDLDTVADFTRAYQATSELSIGETWAIPIMLRLALIEELQRLATGVAAARRSREKAREWAATMTAAEARRRSQPRQGHGGQPRARQGHGEPAIHEILAGARDGDGRLPPAFVVELLQWLRDQPVTAASTWHALTRALEEQDDSADEMLRVQHQREASDQLAIGNVITSMRLVSSVDWTAFFERVSVVEQVLRTDPSGHYPLMDFPTRDRYRHSVEQLAKRAGHPETMVARTAIAMAQAARDRDPEHDRRQHVGYYLISRGRFELERTIAYSPTMRERFARFAFKHPAVGYLGIIGGLTSLSLASIVAYAARNGADGVSLWLVAAIALLPLSELVVSLINAIFTSDIRPRALPKLALRDGIPPALRTMVVVPSIIDSVQRVDALFDEIEVRFLGNRDPHLHFALLSDFADAPRETMTGDATVVEHALARVAELNARHGEGRFLFFHRGRRWNENERRWMGWERKRGKLHEFNRLLRGATDTTFTVVSGDQALFPSVRFVITLDSDTQLPMEAGRRLVGTLSHPLNTPRFDPSAGRVTEGYGLLQPRIGVNLVSANASTFAQVFSGHVGVDPYTTAVSDVYQDLFHEGSYVGKGIYDVDAFEASLRDRVPENTLLSHDLFEGSYARAGLVTDIHLVDDYPPTYLAFAARQHRWARGDWQILRWLWFTVPDASRRPVRNTLPIVARWKIFDNLRRSLLPPSLVALLLCGWTILPGSALFWTLLAFLVIAFPAYVHAARSLITRVRGVPIRQHVEAEWDSIVTSAYQALLSATFLAHQAWLMGDAIARTLWRLVVSRRNLLQWVSADRLAGVKHSPAQVLRAMWAAPVLAVAATVLISVVAPSRLLLALPLIALWLVSPAIAALTGRTPEHARQNMTDTERIALRKVARRTWRFFEDLLGPGDHWLIPDNYQEDREDTIAHRTSPTNVGLQLMSTLAAWDFGYVSTSGVVDRLEPAFATLLKLHRYRGHFYNWYDTLTLAPLAPSYVSTVDSGNLAGYLMTLKQGLAELMESAPLIDRRALDGIADAILLFEESLGTVMESPPGRSLARELVELRGTLAVAPASLAAWPAALDRIDDHLAAIGVLFHELEDAADEAEASRLAQASHWLDRAAVAVAQRRADLHRFTPWARDAESFNGLPSLSGRESPAALLHWMTQALSTIEAGADTRPMRAAIEQARVEIEELIEQGMRLAGLADDLVEEMEFGFLFDRERRLFSIGFSVTDGRLDGSYYDTLASEARLASFVAIATGQIPHGHWFKLGRSLTPTGASRALLSWSASMFEYFMPLLVMRAYPATLLDETYHAVVDRQIHYGAQQRVPWGISESAYNAQDLEGNYQYRAFGVPGLGLKRGLADDLVVAPYASLLATPLVPVDVVRNLKRFAALGMAGQYGFYEAIDFTPERAPEGTNRGVVLPTYMAHHQGMSLVAIDNALNDAPMQRRFHDDPRVQAADLLLQERIPHLVPLKNPPIELAEHVPSPRAATSVMLRRYATPHTLSPRTHLLANGSYSIMLTAAGGGWSRRQHLALTRWREDLTRDNWGTFCYVRDTESGTLWSSTPQPTMREPDEYEVTFAPDRAVFRRLDGDIEVRTEIAVSPEDDAELRRISVTNHGAKTRRLDLTSYAEVVLAPPDADLAHPAFSNLFVETHSVPEYDALIAVRRPRSGGQRQFLVHVLSGRGRGGGPPTQWETDRARFVGRGRTLDLPGALDPGTALSNTTGPVLDPIVSLRHAMRLAPRATARITFTTAYADTEDEARRLIAKYHDRRAVARALALASTHSQVELRHLVLAVEDTIEFQRLGGRLMSGDTRLRDAEAIEQNRRGQRSLWPYGISGDLPILLVRVTELSGVPLVAALLKAHEYLRLKGLAFDLVILNEHPASYLQDLQQRLQALIESGPEQGWVDKPGGVFLRRADLMPPEDQLLLRAAARVVMDAADGDLQNQLTRPHAPFVPGPTRTPVSEIAATQPAAQPAGPAAPPPSLERFNGIGGFQDDGREYTLQLETAAVMPPVPWTNVVGHETFGFACTESGPGFTWAHNSHDNRLTPWRNDPVSDAPGEAIFIRDDESGTFWSATPLPAGHGERYTTRHGQGYSRYEHARAGIESELTLFVPRGHDVKVFRLALKNTGASARRLTATIYAEWVLGENRERTSPHVVTSVDDETGAMLATNAFRPAYAANVAFLDLSVAESGAQRTFTGDRTEFIGRNGTLARPAALGREELSNRTGPAHDPCGAVQVVVAVPPSQTTVVIGLLGDAGDVKQMRETVLRFREVAVVDAELKRVREFWDGVLGTIVVRTPDRAMDLMLNRWLLYQTLVCRIWGRSAFYQSSGAFGFRDQLQDTLALTASVPAIPRAQLLRAASRQFLEGDVQHWWHEPGGQGVRTRFSDDRLWLAYAALHYVSATADDAVLDEQVPFLTGRVLNPGEHEAYEQPGVSSDTASLYEHCVRAIDISLATGAHGLPLMGTGDWNDGMSLVGAEGRGESVWLAWFLISILRPFADLAETRHDSARAAADRSAAAALAAAVEKEAWDGQWYRRAYFDDGTPLGSKQNAECQIDAIAQSWSVISGAGDPTRARRAMASVEERLIRWDARIALLLTPPFDTMEPNPGYIRGYLPGVRENGGQYTHAALWNVLAFAQLGDGDRASDLFSMLNPLSHTETPDNVARYRAEPYVVAADVYSVPPHTGRGGWTWYTGSAGWMYRVGIEAILGIVLRRGTLQIDPCIPRAWPGFEAVVTLRREGVATTFNVVVENPNHVNRGVARLELDHVAIDGVLLPLRDDGKTHDVKVVLGPEPAPTSALPDAVSGILNTRRSN